MFSYAIRYQPILLALQQYQPALVLDVGSGAEGLGLFWRDPLLGVDLAFKRRPLHQGVVGNSVTLPFASQSVPAVVSCDMLEHLPPHYRQQAVTEMARVAGEWLFLTFPSGSGAALIYEQLATECGTPIPLWLEEHLAYGLPHAGEVAQWLEALGWTVQSDWYESAAAHKWLARQEMHLPIKVLAYACLRLLGPWLAPRLPVPSRGAKLRVLIQARRTPAAPAAAMMDDQQEDVKRSLCTFPSP